MDSNLTPRSLESMSSARSTKVNPQTWRWGQPRVLVEEPDEQAGLAIAAGLRFAGFAVGVCPGPRGHGQCPLTGPAGCAAAHEADLVVCNLGYERAVAREVLRELRTRYPSVPLLVLVPSESDADLNELLDECHQLPAGASPEQVVAAVQSISEDAAEDGAARA